MDGMLATLEMVAATDWIAMLPSAICFPDKDGSHSAPQSDQGPSYRFGLYLGRKS